jgi:hypothetical protein
MTSRTSLRDSKRQAPTTTGVEEEFESGYVGSASRTT